MLLPFFCGIHRRTTAFQGQLRLAMAMSKIKENEVVNEGESNGRISHVPFYGFQFRCEERALKRREFSFKLKERFYEKELERAMILTKLKKIEEEEIKMLRKSMVVRANPVPDFYHHPSPPPSPKVKFNKTPRTRAKSPKLGLGRTSPARGGQGYQIYNEMS